MVHLMIMDAHYRICKYQHVIEDQKIKLQRMLTSKHLEILTTAIEISCKRHREQRRNTLKKKLIKISKPPREENTNNCVINLSKQPLTNTEEHLLQKGLNYNTSDASKLQFFAALESSLKTSGISEETQQEIRQTIVPITQQVKENNQLTPREQKALKEFRNRKDIIIIPADKGRTTVIMDKKEYIKKAEELLGDKSTYKLMDTNPVKKLDNQISKTLNKLIKAGEITKQDQWRMKSSGPVLSRFYGRPKIHKPNIPLRPIVALPGTPTYNLSKEISRILRHLVDSAKHSIKSPTQFLDQIKDIQINNDELMISFDVTALFTSTEPQLAKETISLLLKNDTNLTKYTTLQIKSLLELIDLCLTTYFQFNNKIYEQTKGTPMGSPISGLIAEAVMQRLEATILPVIKPKIWIRYVDDTFVIVKKDELENTYKLINNVFNDIKFTMEQESNNQLAFLDILITRTDTGKLETQVYRKPTHTDQILNYNSNNPRAHKINCVHTLFKRARTHCSTLAARKNEEKYLKDIFQKNGYPINFIKKHQRHTASEPKSSTKISKRITLPYIQGISVSQ
ncbi:unnamed protein product [Schistosoma bovis]|nr:unnamed protein product [Schistosoma bovis]